MYLITLECAEQSPLKTDLEAIGSFGDDYLTKWTGRPGIWV